jgi:cephalosporin-C deacetylase
MALHEMDLNLKEFYEYEGSSPKASDFDRFWDKAKEELAGVDPRVELRPADFTCRGVECFDLYFQGVRGARIHAKYARPVTAGKKPCLLIFHGYTGNSGDWMDGKLSYVLEGMCVAALDCRGQGGFSEDTGGCQGSTFHGHVARGLAGNPQDLPFRQMYLDGVELAQIVSSFPEVDGQRLGTLGGSQGGALSVAVSALHGGIKRTAVGYPFLSDFYYCKKEGFLNSPATGYSEIGEYFRRYDPFHHHEDEIFEKLSYIDVSNLAAYIRNPAHVTITMRDTVCPPKTQFAVYNNLGGEKELVLYYDYDHEALPQWADLCFAFLRGL